MRISRLIMTVFAAALLTACQDSGLDLQASTGSRISVGPSVPVAVEALEGLPDSVATSFSAALAQEAQARDIRFVDGTDRPRYRMKGFFNATPAEGGTSFTWVWDISDGSRKRAQRISGSELVRKSGSEPWSVADEPLLRRIAARSLDDIGLFLLPAAQAQTPPVKSGTMAAAVAIGQGE